MRYLAEFYLPARGGQTAALAGRASRAAEEASRAGPPVRFITAIHALEDETCFAIYEAASPAAVIAAGALAGLTFDRVAEIATYDASGEVPSPPA